MGFKTISGALPADVAASGLQEITAGKALSAADLNETLRDLQASGMYAQLPGVLAGGVCSASGLNITIPNGTVYFARNIWITDADVVISVPDASTTYLWGCADGEIRQTATTTPPPGYDARTACILAKATATAGTATLDATAQQKGRYADTAARSLAENALLDLSAGLVVPVLSADPSAPADGQLWYNSTTDQLKVRVGGVTKASGAFS